LDPWADHQPLDTVIGNAVVNPLLPEPTQTPPPTQLSIKLASGCPLMQEWSDKVLVDAPDPCSQNGPWGKPTGSWTKAAEDSGDTSELLRWEETCNIMSFGASFEPIVTYRAPHGDLFGTSQTLTTLVGTTMELRDCVNHPLFTVSEKVSDNAGTIWIQYLIRNETLHLVAQTTKFHPFANEFGVLDHSGTRIADIAREGSWQPSECEPNAGPRRWRISYAQDIRDSSMWADPMQQWPVSQMVTMMSLRDTRRRENGLASPPPCHEVKIVSQTVLIVIFLSAIGAAAILFLQVGLMPMRAFMWYLQNRFCPPRMRVPLKHRGWAG